MSEITFEKDILAIADREVVDCFNEATIRINFPDDSPFEEDLNVRKAFVEKFGFMPLQCGNYIVIKHAHDEYSFYGHIQYQSVKVKPGDHVKQGQPIGKIGNTGKSGCPHLHFQLMNGPDFSSARGLSCHFTNIMTDQTPLSLINEAYTIVQTT